MTFNYKKNKLDQLQGFCSVVEYANSITDAAKYNNISVTTISRQILSLEADIGYLLFDRVKNKLVLNDKGKTYYNETKKLLLSLDKLYDGKIKIPEISKTEILRRKIRKKVVEYKKKLTIKLKMILIKITLKRFLILILAFSICVFLYLHRTNWFFDKKLEKMANPLLREVIKNGHYRIDKSIPCPFDPVQIHIGWNELMLILLKEQYDITMTVITANENPTTPMRLNGNEKVDNVFNNKEAIKCDTERRFEALKKRYKDKISIMNSTKKFRFYNLYRNEDCLNCNIFFENVKKYPDQLFAIKATAFTGIADGRYWILKYKNYYYLMFETNGLQSHNIDQLKERYFIWEKLTLDELRAYDNGSYWELIKNYGLKID